MNERERVGGGEGEREGERGREGEREGEMCAKKDEDTVEEEKVCSIQHFASLCQTTLCVCKCVFLCVCV